MFKTISFVSAIVLLGAAVPANAANTQSSHPSYSATCTQQVACQTATVKKVRRIVRKVEPVAQVIPTSDGRHLAKVYSGPKSYGRIIKPVQNKFTIQNYYKR